MLNIRKEKKNLFRKGLLIGFSLIFLVVGIACGKKDPKPEPSVETPVIVAPDTASNEVVDKDNGPVESSGGEEEDINIEELKDLFKSGQNLDQLAYTMKLTGYGEEPITTKVWMKNGKMRFESAILDQTVISIMNEDAFYTISVNDKMAMKMPLDSVNNPSGNTVSLDDVTENVDFSSFKYIGKEKINGVNCLVVENNNDDLGTTKMWLHEKYGIAMRMETVAKDQVGSFTMEVTEFSVGEVSDDLFNVPEGYEIMDLGDLKFPGLPDTPNKP